ncbi:MAG: ECF-type sigma factor [Phycisphaerales bacterium]
MGVSQQEVPPERPAVISPDPHGITELLHRAADDPAAASRLMPLVYEELHRLATEMMRGERRDHTLQATALVNEAFVRLLGPGGAKIEWKDRAHYLRTAARAMRRILVDYARAHNAEKRGGEVRREHITIDDRAAPDSEGGAGGGSGATFEVLSLHEALEGLAKVHPRMAQVVELRFFGGLTIDQAARVLEVSTGTVEGDWSFARSWLRNEMKGEGGKAGSDGAPGRRA